MAYVKDAAWLIERKNEKTGMVERSTFIGGMRDKPKGWIIIKYLGRAMGTESGTC